MNAIKKMWEASATRREQSQISAFMRFAHEKTGRNLASWQDLYRWSLDETAEFWGCLAEFTGIVWQEPPRDIYCNEKASMLSASWFEGASLNFAENLLPAASEQIVLTCIYENKMRLCLSARDLRQQVAAAQAALTRAGVRKGDYVAGVLCNGPEAIIAMLATASLGGVWCGVSPDFGVAAILDRLQQLHPKVLFFAKG